MRILSRLFRVGLFLGRGGGEGRVREAGGLRFQQAGEAGHVGAEAAGVHQLRHEADVGQRGLGPKQKGPFSRAIICSQAARPSWLISFAHLVTVASSRP